MNLISIVVPCYNEADMIDDFYAEISKSLKSIDCDWELIFVNDGSRDDTLAKIKHIAGSDDRIKYLSFSRNFGKESALYAGLVNSSGDYVAVMDADLQDPPSLLPEMFETLKNSDYDIVATRRISRKGEPVIRSFSARLFYRFINKFSKLEFVDGARDYRLMTRQVVDAVLELNEINRFSKGLFTWVGFNTKWIEYENIQRAHGETSWSFWSLFKYSIEGIVAFTTIPLSISTFLGVVFSIFAFALIIFLVVRHLLFSDPVQGWTSTVCIILLIGGIQLFSIGILGKYLEKTYIEIKNRPIYIVKESNMD